jgi:hypothetical protein
VLYFTRHTGLSYGQHMIEVTASHGTAAAAAAASTAAAATSATAADSSNAKIVQVVV